MMEPMFSDFRVRRAFHAAREARRVKYVLREVVDDWVDETGKIVLIGDAAHPVMVSRMRLSAPQCIGKI